MGKERITIRLYKYHDSDLIYIIMNYEDSISKMFYTALQAFINKEPIKIIPMKKRKEPLIRNQWCYQKQMVLDDKEDFEMIRFLSTLARGARDRVLKSLLRQYLCCPVAEWDFEDPSDYDDYMDNISTLQMRRGVATEMAQTVQDLVNGNTDDGQKDYAEEKNGGTEEEKVPGFRDRDQEEALDGAQRSPEEGGPHRIERIDENDNES